jgi:hypothetical protein
MMSGYKSRYQLVGLTIHNEFGTTLRACAMPKVKKPGLPWLFTFHTLAPTNKDGALLHISVGRSLTFYEQMRRF